jgi:hypothetical protein
MSDSTANFEDHFWGGGLKGFDVLMQNLKNGINASKEMMEFMKERSSIEDAYSKSIHRLNKTLSQVPEANLGAFHPVWMVLVEALDGLGKVHSGYSETFDALHKEISDYHHTQKERLKKNTKGVIDSARDYYLMFEMLEGTVHKSKKQYEHCAAEVAALTCDIQTAPPRVKEKLEEKLKKAEVKLKDSCSEHKDAVAQHCNKVMDVQGKMREAFQKFQSLEEDHISQLLLFVIKYTSTVDYMHQQSQEAHSSMSAKMNTLPNDVLISQFAIKKGTGADKPSVLCVLGSMHHVHACTYSIYIRRNHCDTEHLGTEIHIRTYILMFADVHNLCYIRTYVRIFQSPMFAVPTYVHTYVDAYVLK